MFSIQTHELLHKSQRLPDAPLLPAGGPPWLTTRSLFGIDYHAHRRVIATIERALADRVALTCTYGALSTHEVTRRKVEPGELYWDPTLETSLAPSQRLDRETDGSLILSLEVAGLPEIERWVMGFGPGATVLEPEELVHRVAHATPRAAVSFDQSWSSARPIFVEPSGAATDRAKKSASISSLPMPARAVAGKP